VPWNESFSTFQVTARIGLLKEGGELESYQNCPGQVLYHYGSGQAPTLAKVRFLVVFLKTTSVLVCSQRKIQLPCMKEN